MRHSKITYADDKDLSWSAGGWAGCRPQGAGVADGRAWESRQAPWPCGGAGHDGGCAKAETGVVGWGVRTRGDRTSRSVDASLSHACVRGQGWYLGASVSVPWSV